MIPDMKKTLPERITAIKEALGIKFDSELAELCGVSKQAVYGWVHDGKTPGKKPAQALEEKFGIRAEYFRYGRGHMDSGALSADELNRTLIAMMEEAEGEERTKLASDYIKVLSKYL